jgi:hypothetical protein
MDDAERGPMRNQSPTMGEEGGRHSMPMTMPMQTPIIGRNEAALSGSQNSAYSRTESGSPLIDLSLASPTGRVSGYSEGMNNSPGVAAPAAVR